MWAFSVTLCLLAAAVAPGLARPSVAEQVAGCFGAPAGCVGNIPLIGGGSDKNNAAGADGVDGIGIDGVDGTGIDGTGTDGTGTDGTGTDGTDGAGIDGIDGPNIPDEGDGPKAPGEVYVPVCVDNSCSSGGTSGPKETASSAITHETSDPSPTDPEE